MSVFDEAWGVVKEGEEAEWHPPDTFDVDAVGRYLRYFMDNFHHKLSPENQQMAWLPMRILENYIEAEEKGETYVGFMTPEFAMGQLNHLVQQGGLLDQQMRDLE